MFDLLGPLDFDYSLRLRFLTKAICTRNVRQYISIDLPQSIWSPSVAVHQFHISDLQDIDRSLR